MNQSPIRRPISPTVLARRSFSDEVRRSVRPPIRPAIMGSAASPYASPRQGPGAQAGRKCTAKSTREIIESPLYTSPQLPMQDPRWSVSGAPLHRQYNQSGYHSRRLPRVDLRPLEEDEGGHTEAGARMSRPSFRRRLFGNANVRKSLTLFSVNTGVKGGLLSRLYWWRSVFPTWRSNATCVKYSWRPQTLA